MKGYLRFTGHPIKGNNGQLMRSNRPSDVKGNSTESVQLVIREKIGQTFVSRTVQHQAMCSLLGVMSRKKEDGLAKIGVTQVRMRHQKLARQIWNFTTGWAHCQNLGSDYLLFKGGVINCP